MGNICVIGPRGSGKTTYLAALAYWPDNRRTFGRAKNFDIKPQNPESRELADKAENILCQGLDFQATVIGQEIQTVYDLPHYSFRIDTKRYFFSKKELIQVNVRDYPGEVFEKIIEPNFSNSIHEEFIKECFTDVTGCLILLTGWEKGTDDFYKKVMNQFVHLMDTNGRGEDLRLAVAISKCERGEIWSGRIDPELDLFEVYLPKTRKILRDGVLPKNLRFYAISTFGVLGRNNPRPNRADRLTDGEPASVLREPRHWRPYNMIEPLYWLGKEGKKVKKG